MTKKIIPVAVLVGIAIGATGTYYSNYAFSFFGIQEISIPSMEKKHTDDLTQEILSAVLFTNELQYTLVEVKKTDFGINGEKPLEGGIFLIVKVEIENFGKQEVTVYGKNWILTDENGRTYSPKTFNASPEINDNIFSIRIPPGFKVTKNVGFEIPSGIESERKMYVPDKPNESNPILLSVI